MRRIAITFDPSISYLRGVVNGIRHYIAAHEPWQLLLVSYGERVLVNYGVDLLKRVDGVIYKDPLPAWPGSAVRVFGAETDPGFPVVTNDFREVGRMAARHLIDLNLRSFGVLVNTGGNVRNVGRRVNGFVETVRAADGRNAVTVHAVPRPPPGFAGSSCCRRSLRPSRRSSHRCPSRWGCWRWRRARSGGC